MHKPVAGVNKLTREQSAEMVAEFQKAYENGSPDFKEFVDSARKILLAKKHLHLGPDSVDELICSTMMTVLGNREPAHG